MLLNAIVSGEGHPFIILHGFLGMSDNWKSIANQLSQTFEVHALDLRNHGKSFHADAFSYDLMVEDVKSYLDQNHLSNIILLGHSMGGKVAMQFACEHPSIVEKLIIADIGTKYYPPHHGQILEGLHAVDFSLKPSRSEVEVVLARFIPEFGVRQFLMKNLYWESQGQLAFRFNLKALVANVNEIGKPLEEEYTFLRQTLFLRGEQSNYIKNEDWQEIISHFPLAELQTIPQAGHWLHAEQPELFLQILLKFLNN